MNWIKINFREIWPFWLMGAASGLFIAMTAVDIIKLKECNAQIVELRQELALTQQELQDFRDRVKIPEE